MKSEKTANGAANPAKKPSGADYRKATLFWMTVIFAVFFPILDQLILQTAVLSVDGNIAYEGLSEILSTVLSVLSSFSAYAAYATLACAAAFYGTRAGGTAILSFARHPITLICELISYSLADGSDPDTVVLFILDCLLNLLLNAVIYGLLLLLHRKRGKDADAPLGGKLKGKTGLFPFITLTSLIFGGLQLLSVTLTMIINFLDPSIGLPQNTGETVYLVTEHLSALLFLAVGYFVSVAIAYFTESTERHFSDERSGS